MQKEAGWFPSICLMHHSSPKILAISWMAGLASAALQLQFAVDYDLSEIIATQAKLIIPRQQGL
jgi:hypothetical protein